MNASQSLINILGRLLIVALFLPAGISKIGSFEGTVGYFNSLGIPAASLAVAITILIEVVGSLALLVGYKTKIVAIILAIFTLAASIVGHAYWAAPAEQAFVAQLLFFKNIAVIGGLLILATSESGRFSFDGRKSA
ncbi:DoxX family protein [Polynucleobacter sp. MWH-Loch1C5]|uniref:DoxX family protein n=1 Tax=Polynucleobacter sp. MWH-Loch1C5 TaxID=2689108 RepID=UPI001C0D974F|nr:DoxX family protein [Polynucleobacter sp. MWH-Loch1C5]MBU3541928.1 DoxX family protein [Polynucleobacter sp. MWH-Loch1C5]